MTETRRGKKRPQTTSHKAKKIGRPAGVGSACTHPGCSNKAQSKGKCRTHTGGGKCVHPECDKQAQYKGLCAAHGGRRICNEPNCDKKVASRGKCADHGGGRDSLRAPRGKRARVDNLSLATAAEMTDPFLSQGHESMMTLLVGTPWSQVTPMTHEGPGDITESVVL